MTWQSNNPDKTRKRNKTMGTRQSGGAHCFEGVFVLMLIATLAICSLFAVVFGARVYRNVTNGIDANFSVRTGLSYISNKLRSYDADQISIVDTDSGKALLAAETIGGDTYNTYLYYDNGFIGELSATSDQPFDASAGSEVIKCSGLDFSIPSPGVVKVTLIDSSGKLNDLTLKMRS